MHGRESMCGARFEVLRDGVLAYAAVVASGARGHRRARATTIRCARRRHVLAPGGRAGVRRRGRAALATEPVRASFCDGAAWADAALM